MSVTIDPSGNVFEQMRPRLKAISRRILGSDAEAEDIVQDSFFKWQSAQQAALVLPVAWLTTVVQHQSIDRLRQRARDAAVARAAAELAADAAPAQPDEALERRADLAAALACMLALLSPSERLTLVLHDVLECNHADIAAALGTTAVNARQYLARARRRLRQAEPDTCASERLCQELVRRFQAAINGMDVPAMVTLLGAAQPMSVIDVQAPQARWRASANDARYAAVAYA